MILRDRFLEKVKIAVRRSPVTALLGPRQCGKTTLARMYGEITGIEYYDLESVPDQRRLENPELALSDSGKVIVLDEIQAMPSLFNALRVLVDRQNTGAHFLILGSASPDLIRHVSETLAGRVEFIELTGFNLEEIDRSDWKTLWERGGFPRSYLADDNKDSTAWRNGFIQTFLQRDIPQLGISIPWVAMRRFWTMLAHYHGQTWNASRLANSMGLTDKTVRSYLDILSGTFMIRQLQPWHTNISKRQVKAPKIYFRDSGILHTLLSLDDYRSLTGHFCVGSSWEGFALEQVIRLISPHEPYFWATYGGAELDLFFVVSGKKYGVEAKWNEAPTITRSMRIAMKDLKLDRMIIVYPGSKTFQIEKNIFMVSVEELNNLPVD